MKNTKIQKSANKKIVHILVVLLFLSLFTATITVQAKKNVFEKWADDTADCFKYGENCSGSDQLTSFTDFKGGLAAPSKDGYAPGLTQATDARQYVLNVTNFALGFLGLIAVIIVIYGGFLYITAAGKEEQAGKGKKAVSYAIIGIVLILGSYAIVNTVLQAPSGTDKNLKGAAEKQGTGVMPGGNNFNALASRIETIVKDIVTAYQFNFQVREDIGKAKKQVKLAIEEIIVCSKKDESCEKNLSAINSKFNYFKSKMESGAKLVQGVKNKVYNNAFAAASIKSTASDVNDYILGIHWPALERASQVYSKYTESACADHDEEEGCGIEKQRVNYTPKEAAKIYDAFVDGEEILDKVDENFLKLENITYNDPKYSNFALTINDAKLQLKEMFDQVAPITSVANDEFFLLVEEASIKQTKVQGLKGFLEEALGQLQTTKEDVNTHNKDVTPVAGEVAFKAMDDLMQAFSALYETLKDIQFVDAQVTANVLEGNAPLPVNFSSVGSTDPSGLTIQDKQIMWDLDGDGSFNGESGQPASGKFVACQEPKEGSAVASCIYKVPGTYRVKLKIKASASEDPNKTGTKYDQEIGEGRAYVDIRVNPPENKINLKLTKISGQEDVDIIKYDKGFLKTNVSSYTIALTKAQQGITFDANETLAKDDAKLVEQGNEGATVLWNFGDGINDGVNNTLYTATGNMEKKHTFNKEGSYNVLIEVADKNKIIDRKIFTLIVSTLAPAMKISDTTPKVNEEVKYDCTNSVSDTGPIKDCEWTFPSEAQIISPANIENGVIGDVVVVKYSKPGPYSTGLKVSNDLKSESVSQEVNVYSDPPVAQFKYDIPKKTQPATVQFDGTNSFIPDHEGKLTYEWNIDGQPLGQLDALSSELISDADQAKPMVKFKTKGTHNIKLTVIDENDTHSEPAEKEISIDNILDISWGAKDASSNMLLTSGNDQQEAPIIFNILSETAVNYQIDFGDGEQGSGAINKTVSITHKYKQAGTFIAKATVFDDQEVQNYIARKIYIGSSNAPIGIVGIKINNEEIVDSTDTLTVNRKDVITLDAGKSKNVDGSGKNLTFSWDFGDGSKSTKAQSTHTYKDLGNYKISLKVANANNVAQTAIDHINIKAVGEEPNLRSITAVPGGTSLVTPVTVNLTAVGAEDKDGQIVTYRWWYYDPNNDADQLGVQVTTTPTASIIIGTRGEEKEQKTYQFAVEMTDNENNKVNSRDLLDEKIVPTLNVTNGPNKAPVAKFNVDKTSITVGETVNFSSSSTDQDGEVTKYYWDFEGDGFANNSDDLGPTVTYTYNKSAKEGIKVRLKVIDDNAAEAVSDPVTIFVDSSSNPPVAAFVSSIKEKTVQFTDTTTADTEKGATITNHIWDFDTSFDSNGDGKKDNDLDSTEPNPVRTYPDYGIYSTKLTVEDSAGNSANITNFVNIKAPVAPPAPPKPPVEPPKNPTPPPPPPVQSPTLDARLLTDPKPNLADGKVHLQGQSGSVTFDFSTSVGNIKTFNIDKNIYFDTNGNGLNDDDEDFKTSTPGKWTTTFDKSYGLVRVRLTVTDPNGKKDTVDKDIIFDNKADANYLASVFSSNAPLDTALLVTMAGFGILSLKYALTKKRKS